MKATYTCFGTDSIPHQETKILHSVQHSKKKKKLPVLHLKEIYTWLVVRLWFDNFINCYRLSLFYLEELVLLFFFFFPSESIHNLNLTDNFGQISLVLYAAFFLSLHFYVSSNSALFNPCTAVALNKCDKLLLLLASRQLSRSLDGWSPLVCYLGWNCYHMV